MALAEVCALQILLVYFYFFLFITYFLRAAFFTALKPSQRGKKERLMQVGVLR